jgi:serine protease SohB
MEFWIPLALFAAKAFIWVFAIIVIAVIILVLIARARGERPDLTVENINDVYEFQANALKSSILDDKELKADQKAQKKKDKAESKQKIDKKRIFVLNFIGDIRASRVDSLRDEVTSILSVARAGKDEVVVIVESPGGMVHTYGLAASQLVRFRERNIHLTVCVDKVAASGGYLMACTANKIIGAPFAIIGSIGVVAQVPNLHRLLKKHDVDYEEITAGEFKRTVSLLGEITPKGREKFIEQIEETHDMFKDFVKDYRPHLQVEKVATGEYWYGKKAQELGLIDEIMASDEYLFRQKDTADIYEIETPSKKKLAEKVAENFGAALERTLQKVLFRSPFDV